MEIAYIVTKAQECIARLYPILYADEFKSIEHSAATRSAVADPDLLARRKALISSALRYGPVHSVRNPVKEAPCELTTFKPFSLRELDYDVWDTKRSKQEKYLSQFNSRGLLHGGAGPAPSYNQAAQPRQNEPYHPPYQDSYPANAGGYNQGNQGPSQYGPPNPQYGNGSNYNAGGPDRDQGYNNPGAVNNNN